MSLRLSLGKTARSIDQQVRKPAIASFVRNPGKGLTGGRARLFFVTIINCLAACTLSVKPDKYRYRKRNIRRRCALENSYEL